MQLKGYIHSYSLPPTVVLDVVVVVEAALVVVPFLVPVTNSIWERCTGEKGKDKKKKELLWYTAFFNPLHLSKFF